MGKLTLEVQGIALTLLSSVVLSALVGLALFFTNLPETLLAPLSTSVLVLSIFAGAGFITYKHGNRGLIRGTSFGLICFLLMVALSFFHSEPMSLLSVVRILCLDAAAGVLGGILGVSLAG